MGILDNIDAVIFDMDGTLIDSMWMWEQIDIDYLARFGYTLPADLQESIEGMSFKETADYIQKRFNIPEDTDTMMKTWIEMAYEFYRTKVGFKPGAREFLTELKRRGIKIGMATSNAMELVDVVLDHLDAHSYFDEIHVSSEVKHGKPFPDIYLLVAEKLGVSHDRCLVFEDILPGIRAGRAARMKVCSVYDRYAHQEINIAMRYSDYYIRGFDVLMDTPSLF
ncbi:MAG: HAD family phosphatase [Lachnospiraceae bacterium]|nr:HAD family phosphatase [Lachnospiraceae bacterium]